MRWFWSFPPTKSNLKYSEWDETTGKIWEVPGDFFTALLLTPLMMRSHCSRRAVPVPGLLRFFQITEWNPRSSRARRRCVLAFAQYVVAEEKGGGGYDEGD